MSCPERPARSPRRLDLSTPQSEDHADVAATAWDADLERVVQNALKKSFDRHLRRTVDLPASHFVEALREIAGDRRRTLKERAADRSPELLLFERPLLLAQFNVVERQYSSSMIESCCDHGVDSRQLLDRLVTLLGEDARSFKKEPRTEELLMELMLHLLDRDEHPVAVAREDEDYRTTLPLHSARRAIIRNWQSRLEQHERQLYDHDESVPSLCSYPFVDLRVFGRDRLVVLFVTPLDMTFVDDKVPEDHRLCEIALGVFDILEHTAPHTGPALRAALRQALARVVFTHSYAANSNAMTASSGELGTISRHWYSRAAEGLPGLMDDSSAEFDGIAFGEAVIKRLLCTIDGVSSIEVFPFDRAFLFRESGSSSKIHHAPISMKVLEASILSNNPADRGQSLTRRERRLRGTDDFECNAALKSIQDEDCVEFFLHENRIEGEKDSSLILARTPVLNAAQMESAHERAIRSNERSFMEQVAYRVAVPWDIMEDAIKSPARFRLSSAMYNLLGRLIGTASEQTDLPLDDETDPEKAESVPSTTYKSDFQKMHLDVLQRADADGVYMEYGHALDLAADVPLLHELQLRYFDYLKTRYRTEDLQLRKDWVDQQNIEAADQRDRLIRKKEQDDQKLSQGRVGSAKVVFISFSWELHDENMRHFREDQREHERKARRDNTVSSESPTPLLDENYTYTIILVSDSEPDKNLLQLQRESVDLKTVLKILMREIWMDRVYERRYLAPRSESIGLSLEQFLHRTKALITNEEDNRSLGEIIRGLKEFTRVRRGSLKPISLTSASELLEVLLSPEGQDGTLAKGVTATAGVNGAAPLPSIEARLEERANRISAPRTVRVRFEGRGFAEARVPWLDVIIKDAFSVAFKNACEASLGSEDPEVAIRVELFPQPGSRQFTHYLDVVIENTGGPIPAVVLESLSASTPAALGKSLEKSRSTGIGVYLTRKQLQSSIGRGADLLFANLPNGRVECRLRLPATIAYEEAAVPDVGPTPLELLASASVRTGEPGTAARGYALLVEDDPEAARRLLQALPGWMPVRHATSRAGAEALLALEVPRLVLTDFTIPARDARGETAQAKHGMGLLETLLRTGREVGSRFPVWIISMEDERVIRDHVSHQMREGYDFVPFRPASPGLVAAPGTLCIMSRLKQVPEDVVGSLTEPLTRLFCDTTPSGPELPAAWGSLEEVAFDSPDFESELAAITSRQKDDGSLFAVVNSAPASWPELAELVTRWLGHPGVPDADGALSGVHPPSSSYVHKRLLLSAEVPGALLREITPRFAYWALGHNLVFASHETDASDLVADWRHLRQESGGALSALRHDVRNALSGWSNLQRIVDAITDCERRLRVPKPVEVAIEAEMRHRGPEVLKRLRDAFADSDEDAARLEAERDAVVRDLDRIGREIGVDGRAEGVRQQFSSLRNLLRPSLSRPSGPADGVPASAVGSALGSGS